jgi:hypothetical protein
MIDSERASIPLANTMKPILVTIGLLAALATPLGASLITFDSGVGPGVFRNPGAGALYTEAGFTLSALYSSSALIGPPTAGYPSLFPGDDTAFLGFDAANVITLTGPAPFSLTSALIGPITYPYGYGPAVITITGTTLNGKTLSVSFYNLTTATEESIGFSNLQSATFSATHSAGLDDIAINETIPEPGSFFLAGTALALGIAARFFGHRTCSVRA